MKTTTQKAWNIRRLDVRAFAEARAHWDDERAVSDLERLAAECCPGGDHQPSVHWHIHGDMRPGAGAEPSVWLHLLAHTTIPLSCQRCLGPVDTPLDVNRWFRFVADEGAAAAQDDDSEEDVLALDPRPDLLALVEDELLMALPLVPMHGTCPSALANPDPEAGASTPAEPAAPHPFAVLSTLKR
jgi:uncharacterized protein